MPRVTHAHTVTVSVCDRDGTRASFIHSYTNFILFSDTSPEPPCGPDTQYLSTSTAVMFRAW